MWTYRQASGTLDHDGLIAGVGYSGAGAGKNNPSMESIANEGPLPCGLYTIGDPFDSPTHGPHAMHLIPDADNEMFGRSAFLFHGDSSEHPGRASEGCIIMARTVRGTVSKSADNRLTVTR